MSEEEKEAIIDFEREVDNGRWSQSDILLSLDTGIIILDLFKKQQKEIEELEYEKKLNAEKIFFANNMLCSYEEGYQAGLNKEITAVEIVVRNSENFIIKKEIKRLKDTIYELHNKLDEGNKKVSRDYISKDKIREKIQDLKETISRMDIEDIGRMLREEQILILEEILEENNND